MELRRILEQLAAGELDVETARRRLAAHGFADVEDFARLDAGRHSRKGVPEVVYAPGKTPEQLLKICHRLLEDTGSAIVSGLRREHWQALEERFGDALAIASRESATAVLREQGQPRPGGGGTVGVLAAGTADVGAAEQAAIMAAEMGCRVIRAYDVGVAGIHRLAGPLEEMMEAGAAALVVAAGMEGALPSVVSGLVAVPVIGLPTSTGYGMGGEGVAALLSMLQSCSPGLVAVNIDNGIGAGATAALIANNAAARRADGSGGAAGQDDR